MDAPPDLFQFLHLPEAAVDSVQLVPESIEGGGGQGKARDLEGFSAGHRLVPQLADHLTGSA